MADQLVRLNSNFVSYKPFIELNDLVVLYFSPNDMRPVQVTKNLQIHTHLGLFNLEQCIGNSYGSKVYSSDGKKFVIVLHPTPELWTLVLPHRTQILYLADISFITWMLNIKPGSIVIESGTGSGSFTHSLARTVYPNGHVFTFEYHEERYKSALLEFELHFLSPLLITVAHSNVVTNGFGTGCTGIADAVFLDLPKPWEAIVHAKETFRKNQPGRICCFSPCIEQVQKTIAALDSHGFKQITMYECLMKDYSVVQKNLSQFPTANSVCESSVDEEVTTNVENDSGVELDKKRMKNELEGAGSCKNTRIYALQSPHECRGHTSYLTFATIVPN